MSVRSSFITGFASIFNIPGNFYPFGSAAFSGDPDQQALRTDWQLIGGDLQKVLNKPLVLANRRKKNSTASVTDGHAEDSDLSNADRLVAELSRAIHPESVPEQEINELEVTITTSFSGPLPSPFILEQYERVLPGCAERLVAAFEHQYRHRIELEARTNKAQLYQSAIGQMMGGLIVIACLSITAWMGFLGHTGLAVALGTTTVVGLATIYFLGKKASHKSKGKRGRSKKV